MRQIMRMTILLLALSLVGCASNRVPQAELDRLERSLALDVVVSPSTPAPGEEMTMEYILRNIGNEPVVACLGENFGFEFVDTTGRSSGAMHIQDHNGCREKFSLAKGQELRRSETFVLSSALRPGPAKMSAHLSVVASAGCDPLYGCYDIRVSLGKGGFLPAELAQPSARTPPN